MKIKSEFRVLKDVRKNVVDNSETALKWGNLCIMSDCHLLA